MAYAKVSGSSSCTAEGYEYYDDSPEGCVAAAEELGFDFTISRNLNQAVPVQHNLDQDIPRRFCVVCVNMIYRGRPTMLFFDREESSKNPTQCNQDGRQTKYHVCRVPGNTNYFLFVNLSRIPFLFRINCSFCII